MKMNSNNIEWAVAKFFNYRSNIIVPNIHWGAGLHECDVLIIQKSKFAIEVEIKISIADLKADFKKKHGHISEQIKYLYYAIPERLYEKALPLIPLEAGILTITTSEPAEFSDDKTTYYHAHIKRKAKQKKVFRKMTDDEVINIARLGCIRMWAPRMAQTLCYRLGRTAVNL